MDALPDATRQAADLRTLQIIWGAVIAGMVLMTLVMGGLVLARDGEAARAPTLFYLNAGVNIVAVVAAFAVQYRLMSRLASWGTYDEIVAGIRTAGITSLAMLEASAIVAGIVTFLAGELINLLFVVPFFGFALAFFPTLGRFMTLLDAARRR